MVSIRDNDKKERRDRRGLLLLALLFFLLFPYIASGFSEIKKQKIEVEEIPGQIWVMKKHLWGSERIALEDYLIGMVAATIPAEYNMETLKAQAVIMRSFCVKNMVKEAGRKVIFDDCLKEYFFSKQEYEELWGEKTESYENKIKEAVKKTQGMILVCNEEILQLPFFRISNGFTRDITEYVVHKEKYEYMKSVECKEDEAASEYIKYVEISEKDFQKNIKKLLKKNKSKLEKIVLYRDKNGYIKMVRIGENKIDGEKFRKQFHLASSDFSLDKINDKIEIQTKGMGHGYGFSQYTANQMALSGKGYQELLEYFFNNISLKKI